MLTLPQFVDSMRHDTRVIQHLATKIPPDAYDWRPSPDQRSMLELLRYMAIMSLSPVLYTVNQSWDHYDLMSDVMKTVTPENFAAKMDEQLERIIAAIGGRADFQAAVKAPWGRETTLGQALVNTALKHYAAYKMQLYLYVRGAGVSDLGTTDLWAGKSAQQ